MSTVCRDRNHPFQYQKKCYFQYYQSTVATDPWCVSSLLSCSSSQYELKTYKKKHPSNPYLTKLVRHSCNSSIVLRCLSCIPSDTDNSNHVVLRITLSCGVNKKVHVPNLIIFCSNFKCHLRSILDGVLWNPIFSVPSHLRAHQYLFRVTWVTQIFDKIDV